MAVDPKYVQGPGGFYDSSDGSGPYSIDSTGAATQIGAGGGGSGGGGGLTNTELRASPVPVSGPLTDAQLRASGIAVTGPATDAQLRATPLVTTPKLTSGGNRRVNITTANVALAAQACSQVTIINRMDTDIVVTIGGNELDIMARSYFTFFGIANLSALGIKGSEAGNISLRWEA
ncbi:MAG: hypothetical protein [Caudoviricetes sp.]|nr:MAG: hypothetical protein [Caudoviricetes sp.]